MYIYEYVYNCVQMYVKKSRGMPFIILFLCVCTASKLGCLFLLIPEILVVLQTKVGPGFQAKKHDKSPLRSAGFFCGK